MPSYSDNLKFDDVYDKDIPITPFIRFWKIINDILIKRGQPEMLYGEAQDWFVEMNSWRGECITPFIRFWKIINDILIKRGQPEMLYGKARDWFEEMNSWGGE